MTDVVIRAADLRKVYRLYSKPSYRFRDMFGLLGVKPGAYTEHAALDGIGLEIRRGEKVAIIGRNGAGKSTLLKLVTGAIEPTSGTLAVTTRVHALLQIGTGFHPDFTGRENVYAYLAQLGVSGREADRRCAETVEFAELEEYIDQPVKTYSTGMAVRLMFSVSTAITPDLLVLDEVLGVGDAYFAHKSYERIRSLCDQAGTTLLLVTHDIYSAAKLCERLIWIDRGTVLMDGAATDVVKAYEESIRLQEERRLRAKMKTELLSHHLLFEIQARGGQPQPSAILFSRISLIDGSTELATLPLGSDAFAGSGSRLVQEASCWGEDAEWQGRLARPLLNYGSSFHKGVGIFAVPPDALEHPGRLSVAIEYWADQECTFVLRVFQDGRAIDLGSMTTAVGRWAEHVVFCGSDTQTDTSLVPEIRAEGVQGAGDIVLTTVSLRDALGRDIRTVKHGEPVTFRAGYHIRRQGLRERAEVFMVISRNATERVCKFMSAALLFDQRAQATGTIELALQKMMLGAGTYSVAMQVSAEGYCEKGFVKFFSIDPEVYCCITHAFEFTVTTSGWIGDGTIFEGEGEWGLSTESA